MTAAWITVYHDEREIDAYVNVARIESVEPGAPPTIRLASGRTLRVYATPNVSLPASVGAVHWRDVHQDILDQINGNA